MVKNGVKRTDYILTASYYFTDDQPGISSIITHNNMTTYDAVELLKEEIGLYYAERREY